MNTPANPAATTSLDPPRSMQQRVTDGLSAFPWWGLFLLLLGVFLGYSILADETYNSIFNILVGGVSLTARTTLTAYAMAITIGLFTALGQLSKNVIIRNIATVYVQVIRGVPILVQIFYVAFVIVPFFINASNAFGAWEPVQSLLGTENVFATVNVRQFDFVIRGIIALAISYGAFSSEIFRAGIQSIERGQTEAAEALGLNRFQTLRHIILPQAVRRVLPPLGNDFIAMLKESSLLSVLGVGEITQLARKYAGASFLFPETYNTLAFMYLTMTLVLSMGVKLMERFLKTD